MSLARRIGKTVQIRCGPAAVTGNEAYTMPLQSIDCGKEWAEDNAGSQKTCLIVCFICGSALGK